MTRGKRTRIEFGSIVASFHLNVFHLDPARRSLSLWLSSRHLRWKLTSVAISSLFRHALLHGFSFSHFPLRLRGVRGSSLIQVTLSGGANHIILTNLGLDRLEALHLPLRLAILLLLDFFIAFALDLILFLSHLIKVLLMEVLRRGRTGLWSQDAAHRRRVMMVRSSLHIFY